MTRRVVVPVAAAYRRLVGAVDRVHCILFGVHRWEYVRSHATGGPWVDVFRCKACGTKTERLVRP